MPNIFDTMKKGLDDFVGRAANELNDESNAHMAVSQLLREANHVLRANKNSLDPETKEAAEGFIRELGGLLAKDKSNVYSKLAQNQHQLLTQTINVISKYQPKLESSPGFWNQLKAKINTFVENVSGVKDLLSVKKTEHGSNHQFQSMKDQIREIKSDLENPKEENEHTSGIRGPR